MQTLDSLRMSLQRLRRREEYLVMKLERASKGTKLDFEMILQDVRERLAQIESEISQKIRKPTD